MGCSSDSLTLSETITYIQPALKREAKSKNRKRNISVCEATSAHKAEICNLYSPVGVSVSGS
jgi:hypothetical protein